MNPVTLLLACVSLLYTGAAAQSFTSYANDFFDPSIVVQQSATNSTRVLAQETIIQWAKDLSAQGPWSVVNKPYAAPSGDKHDYLSWAPYWWPNCTGVGNTTELPAEQIWTTCPYYQRDGLFNPDVRTVDNTGDFDAISNAVLYNAMAWVLNGSDAHAANAVRFVQTWFLDADTAMNPNLNYAQMQRGPNGQLGTHTGVLDLKGFVKIVNGILILQNGKSAVWTDDIRSQMAHWTAQYVQWLEANPIALAEAVAPNNHGTFYYNQLAALKLLLGDTDGARNVTQTYFNTLYLNQIDANGEQARSSSPLEAVRTRPYHYRAYNLAAMITNARIAQFAGLDAWNFTTTKGGTIQRALDFAMGVDPGDETADELYPSVGAVASVYGDEGSGDSSAAGKYTTFLEAKEVSYPAEPWFFWNQPLSDGGYVAATLAKASASASNATATGSASGKSKNTAVRRYSMDLWAVGGGLAVLWMAL